MNPAKKIAINLFATLLIVIATVFGIIVFFTKTANENAVASTKKMVAAGVAQKLNEMSLLTSDYAFWPAAEKAVLQNDKEWIDENIGTGIVDAESFDAGVILTPDFEISTTWTIIADNGLKAPYFDQALVAHIKREITGKPTLKYNVESFFWSVDGQPVVISYQRITAIEELDANIAATKSILVFARDFDADEVVELGAKFLIDNLSFVSKKTPKLTVETNHQTFAILDPAGNIIAELNWNAPEPGTKMLSQVALPAAIALFISLVAAAWTAMRAGLLAKQLAAEKQHAIDIAWTDTLTGLANRNYFNEVMSSDDLKQLAEVHALAVFYLDINNFKTVNDTMGHRIGDLLITQVAAQITSVLPENTLAARLGGDEFVVLGLGLEIVTNAKNIANDISRQLDRIFALEENSVQSSSAVGYAVAEKNCTDPAEVLRRADLAMYSAKKSNDRNAKRYHPSMDAHDTETREIAATLRRAIAADAFTMTYQPILDTGSRKIRHVEALVRLKPGFADGLMPERFIKVAESEGLIHELGQILFKKVIADCAHWPELSVGINVSPIQLLNRSFVDFAVQTVHEAGITPSRIVFELTEGVLIDSPKIALQQLNILKDNGFGLHLDDFGSGFSSIGYLHQFPFDAVKIDRDLMLATFGGDIADKSLNAIIALARTMKLDVIAEGVETFEQAQHLIKHGCSALQGFHISRPIAAADLKSVVDSFDQAENANLLAGIAQQMRVDLNGESHNKELTLSA